MTDRFDKIARTIRRRIKREKRSLAGLSTELRGQGELAAAEALQTAQRLTRTLLVLEGYPFRPAQADALALRWLVSWARFDAWAAEKGIEPTLYLRAQVETLKRRRERPRINALRSAGALSRFRRWLKAQRSGLGSEALFRARIDDLAAVELDPVPALIREFRESEALIRDREADPRFAGFLSREQLVLAAQIALSGAFLLFEPSALARFERARQGPKEAASREGLAIATVRRMEDALFRLSLPGVFRAVESAVFAKESSRP